jgi:hypothetical protein
LATRLTAWAAHLPEVRTLPARLIDWLDWSCDVTTYGATFESPFPKRNKAEWKANWPREYGKPPLLGRVPDETSIGEWETVQAFRAAGWDASWTDTFGQAPQWMAEWKLPLPPTPIQRRVDAVRRSVAGAKPWDVIAWTGRQFRVVEFKQPKEGFTDAEKKFAWGAYQLGWDMRVFAVVEGTILFPERPEEPVRLHDRLPRT